MREVPYLPMRTLGPTLRTKLDTSADAMAPRNAARRFEISISMENRTRKREPWTPATHGHQMQLHARGKTLTFSVGADLPDQVIDVHVEGARQIIECCEAGATLVADH